MVLTQIKTVKTIDKFIELVYSWFEHCILSITKED